MKVSVPLTVLVATLGLSNQADAASTATKCKRSIRNILTSSPYNFSTNDFSVTYDGNKDVTVHCTKGTQSCNRLQTLNLTEVSNKSSRNCDVSKIVADMASSANANKPTEKVLLAAIVDGVAAIA